MKKWLSISLITILLFTVIGCSAKKQIANPQPSSEDDNHIVVNKNDIKLAVSNQPKNLKKLVPASQKGFDVISINVVITNHTPKTIHVSPDFVQIVTDKNNTYKWMEDDALILGKSAFRDFDVPGNDTKGGGKITFEIKPDETVSKLIYKDDSGHDITIEYKKPASKI